jgi:hypothetical protein
VKNSALPPTDIVGPHEASSKEKAILAIHPRSSERARSSERGILAFSRERFYSYPSLIIDSLVLIWTEPIDWTDLLETA